MQMNKRLKLKVNKAASDSHLTVSSPPVPRVNESNNETNTDIRLWVQRITCTNLFTLLIMARDIQWDKSVFRQVEIERYLDIFKNALTEYKEKYNRDDVPHSTLICYASTAIWDSDPRKQQVARREAIKIADRWCSFPRPHSKPRLEVLKRVLSPSKN